MTEVFGGGFLLLGGGVFVEGGALSSSQGDNRMDGWMGCL